MRDFLPEDVRRRRHVIGVIADVYQQYGFEPLETPSVENLETLQGKYGEEGDRLIFKILKRGEGAETGQADLALRYDLTVPLARVVAEYRGKLPKFFKRYQVQPVWRADRPQKGRFREFYQCDVDAIGSKSMVVEAELLSAAADVLTRLGFADFTIRLNHRRAAERACSTHGGVPAELHDDALVAIDKLDKIGRRRRGRGVCGAGHSVRRRVAAARVLCRGMPRRTPMPDPDRFNRETLARLSGLVTAKARPASRELRGDLSACAARLARLDTSASIPASRAACRTTPASIFEIRVPDLAGSLGGGGRYDNLIGMFSGEDVPACGISLGLERILVVMGERNMFPPSLVATPADVMVVQWFAANAPTSAWRWRPSCGRRACASSSIQRRRPKTIRRAPSSSSSSMRRPGAFHLQR